VNAILKASKLIDAVYGIRLGQHPIGGKDTINVGTIRGGDQTNMVPDWCKLTFDVRFSPPITSDQVEKMVHDACSALARTDPEFKLKSSKVVERRETVEFPADGQLAQTIRRAGAAVLGVEPKVGAAVSFGDVADWKDTIGLKEACMFGPGKTDQAHALNEHVAVDEAIQAAKVYALSFADLLMETS